MHKYFFSVVFFFLLFYPISFVFANVGPTVIELKNPIQIKDKSGQVDTHASKDIRFVVGSIVKKALTIIGSITLMVFVAGGFMWLTSAGNEDRVKRGTETMVWAAVGIAVIFGSYAILSFLLTGLSGGGGGAGGGPLPGQQVTYYTLKKVNDAVYIKGEPKDDSKTLSAFPKNAAVDCIAGTGTVQAGWIEVKDAGNPKATGWVNGQFLTPSTSKCGGATSEKKTKCETQTPYKDTHSCQDTAKFSAEQKKNCVPLLCENAILKAKGVANPNEWMCCVK